jgi:hypothetical protein
MSESQMKRINPVRYLIKRVNYIKSLPYKMRSYLIGQLSNGVKRLHGVLLITLFPFTFHLYNQCLMTN